jgi:TolB-like protein/AraC-like DNA-binding protein
MAPDDNTLQGNLPVSRDEKFILNVRETVLANLENEQFGVEQLASAMAMSRIQLYRKLHRLTGKNVSRYIREVRLEKAMELLRQDVAGVAEIAYRVGFGSPAYFNRCFHDRYGLTPGEIIRRKEPVESKDLNKGDLPVEAEEDSVLNPSIPLPAATANRGILSKIRLAAIGILLIVSVIGIFFIRREEPAAGNKEKSIAVFPLCLDDHDHENAYFCNGMAEEMFTQLDKIDNLKVKSRLVIESFIDKQFDLDNIRRKTGLDYILTLSTRKSANDLRISVQLVELLTGDQIWADTYEGEYSDKIFEFHSKTARQIAAVLDVVISPEGEKELEKIPAQNMRAYDDVIRGRYEYQEYWQTGDISHLKKANVFYEDALKIVPDYPEALGGKCSVFTAYQNYDSAHYYADRMIELARYSNKGYGHKGELYFFSGDMDLAIENYLKAVNLPPRDNQWVWWHAALGRAYNCHNDPANAIKYMKKSVDLGFETHDFVYNILGGCYIGLGDYDKAGFCFLKAHELKPENCWHIDPYIVNLCFQSRIEDALDFLDSICFELDCEKVCLGTRLQTYVFGNRFNEAAETYEQIKRLQIIPGPFDTINLACLYVKTFKPDSADLILEPYRCSLEKQLVTSKDFRLMLLLAIVHGYMNNREAMIRCLKEAFEQGLTYYAIDLIRMHPIFEILWEYPELGTMVDEQMEKRARVRAEVAAMEGLAFRTLNTE